MTYRKISITRITTTIALFLAVVVAVALPSGFFMVSYENMAGRIEAETEINGRLMTQLINDNPDLWRYETLRTTELLARRPQTGSPEIRRLLDMSGKEVAATGPKLTPPLVSRHSVIMEYGKPVAQLEIIASYSGILVRTALTAALGLLLGLAFYLTMRILPLRAVAKAEEALREANDFLFKVMQSSTNGIFVLDTELRVMMANRRAAELLGCEEIDIVGHHFLDLLAGKEGCTAREPLHKLLQDEVQMVHFDAEVRSDRPVPTVLYCGAAPVFRNLSVKSIVVTAEDITERKLAEKHIQHLAYFDGLTGLPNRSLFNEHVEWALSLAERSSDSAAAIMLVDLDNFKRINDTLGHRIGDQVLKIVSDRLMKCLRKTDFVSRPGATDDLEMVARFGGDEFTILLSMIRQEDDPVIVAQRIVTAFAEPLVLDQHEVFVTLSVGVSVYPKDGTTLDVLLKNADIAMYQAKSGGKNGFKFYRHSMNEHALERLTLENRLYKAVEQKEFLLYYQPKMHIASGGISSVEALIRWRHPEIGMISPLDFISIAEENGLIMPITQWVIAEACRQAKSWQTGGLGSFSVAVNISTHLFKQKGLVQMVIESLEVTGLDPSYLELEITESVMLNETSQAIEVLKRFQQMGIKISIDDFGTGYSSFGYLKKLPVNAIKIDRSFINDLPTNKEDIAIVKAIIATSHSLGLRVIAEGVETAEQLHLLSAQDCDEMQGYLLSRPLPPEDFADFMMQRCLKMAG